MDTMDEKKQTMIPFIVSLLFLLIIFILSMYFYIHKSRVLVDDSLDVRFETSDVIEIKNILPVSDTLGKSLKKDSVSPGVQGYVEFSIQNKSRKTARYQIYLTSQNVSKNKIKENYIKLYLTDSSNQPMKGFDTNIIPTYYFLKPLEDKENSKLLYEGLLVDGESENFILRMWLSDSYGKNEIDENYIVDVDVRVV